MALTGNPDLGEFLQFPSHLVVVLGLVNSFEGYFFPCTVCVLFKTLFYCCALEQAILHVGP